VSLSLVEPKGPKAPKKDSSELEGSRPRNRQLPSTTDRSNPNDPNPLSPYPEGYEPKLLERPELSPPTASTRRPSLDLETRSPTPTPRRASESRIPSHERRPSEEHPRHDPRTLLASSPKAVGKSSPKKDLFDTASFKEPKDPAPFARSPSPRAAHSEECSPKTVIELRRRP
jgi:hypothetical protein